MTSQSSPEEQPNIGRSASTVLLGTLAGNGVAWALNFVLARLFTNDVFGLASVVIAVASIFIGISTMRLEVLSQSVTDESEATLLRRAALGLSVWWGVGLTLAAGVAVLAGAGWYWLSLGVLVTLGSLQLVGAATCTRERAYGTLTWTNLQQAAGMGILQVGFGLISAGTFSLLAGFGSARLVWVRVLTKTKPQLRPWSALREEHRRFASVAGTSALVNALAGQASILLVGVLYSSADVGNYAMGVRIIAVPLAVLSQAVAAATIGEIGALIRHGRPWLAPVLKTVWVLVGIGFVVCAGAVGFGLVLAPSMLGPGWDGAGVVIAMLALGHWAQFAVSPFSQLLNLTKSHRALLVWDITRLVVLSGAWVVPAVLGAPMTTGLALYSVAMVGVYLMLLVLIRRCADGNR